MSRTRPNAPRTRIALVLTALVGGLTFAAVPAVAHAAPLPGGWTEEGALSDATPSWVYRGASPGRPGNVHMGGMRVEELDPRGTLIDLWCPKGVPLPTPVDTTGCTVVDRAEFFTTNGSAAGSFSQRDRVLTVSGQVTFEDLTPDGEYESSTLVPIQMVIRGQGDPTIERRQSVECYDGAAREYRFFQTTFATTATSGRLGSYLVPASATGRMFSQRLFYRPAAGTC